MMRNLIAVVIISLAAACLGFAAESPLINTRATLENWVETRQLIGKTKADWHADKDLMVQTIDLYERELKLINEQASQISTNNTQVEKERLEAETRHKASHEALAMAKEFATRFEVQIQKLVLQLPMPLQELLKKDLARIPSDPAKSKMLAAERMQVLAGILNEIDKFNNALNVFSERRKNANGEDVSVETVYVGLGAAYFVNDSGNFAGMGAPSAGGWVWTIKPELAPTLKEVLLMYRNERTAQFVTLPVAIQ